MNAQPENDNPPVRVVFRTWKHKPDKGFNGGVIALFPDDVCDYSGNVSSYEHVGQHGAADYGAVIGCTRPAKPEEYAPLQRELESAPYHYRLAIRRRRSR